LERFGNDPEAYANVLRSYTQHTPALLDSLEVACANPNTSATSLAMALHGLKGSSSGIMAVRVAAVAQDLEAEAGDGDLGIVRARVEDLVHLTRDLITDIQGFLAQLDAGEHKPQLDHVNPELLERLRQAAHDYDMGALDACLDELNEHSYREDGDLATWLNEMAATTELQCIEERLSHLETF
jgi:HPt (histidine-containing phosphotransfer) domain-containing protein